MLLTDPSTAAYGAALEVTHEIVLDLHRQGTSSYILFDRFGKNVRSGTATDRIVVDVSELPAGNYSLNIIGPQHGFAQRKVRIARI